MTDTTDETMAAITAAVELGRNGHTDQARSSLGLLWDQLGPDGDPLHRCSLAHFMADLQDDLRVELEWDRRALDALTDLDDERAQRYHSDLRVQAFLPSLHTNLADDHRRLGQPDLAYRHLGQAEAACEHLPGTDYGKMMRTAIDHVRDALDTGSTARLPSAPSS